ncbi:MAG: LacI family DNA-binding transcriptional regulator [Anaerolineae bacterium]|nr:LacI family DNA-binding transcriptional regulator [Anaerolineae bacterium]
MSADNLRPNQPVTIYDVAAAAGVSYSTVSRVLNGFEFVKESTRVKVMDAAERLGYVANLQARGLAGGRSNIIGLLVPVLDNSYVSEVMMGIDEALARAGFNLMLFTTHRHAGKEQQYASTIASMTDGLILLVPLESPIYLNAIRERNYPHVLVDQTDESGASASVSGTNWHGAYEATQHLIMLGHRRIGVITGLLELSSARERLNGYRAALQDYAIPIDESLIVEGDYLQPRGYEAAQELLKLRERPSAIFAMNDLSALGAMDAIRESGLSIPEDISLVGFDDIPQAAITHPKLTTVRQPLVQMGRIAVRLLLEQLDHPGSPPGHETLATQLVIRASSQPPR